MSIKETLSRFQFLEQVEDKPGATPPASLETPDSTSQASIDGREEEGKIISKGTWEFWKHLEFCTFQFCISC
jgi:hypothetical protein